MLSLLQVDFASHSVELGALGGIGVFLFCVVCFPHMLTHVRLPLSHCLLGVTVFLIAHRSLLTLRSDPRIDSSRPNLRCLASCQVETHGAMRFGQNYPYSLGEL